jgi:hypothetical protein
MGVSVSDIPSSARVAVKNRCQSRCEVCGIGPLEAVHHRQRRREGGHAVWNLLGLDSVCHARIHAHPKWAHVNGWIVSVHDENPALVPARIRGDLCWLTEEGDYLKV